MYSEFLYKVGDVVSIKGLVSHRLLIIKRFKNNSGGKSYECLYQTSNYKLLEKILFEEFLEEYKY